MPPRHCPRIGPTPIAPALLPMLPMILRHSLRALSVLMLGLAVAQAQPAAPASFNVRAYGAKGDGATLDTAAINAAIDAAAAAGGGTVYFPAGTYPSFSIRLKSHITLYLDSGATLEAARPSADLSAGYD